MILPISVIGFFKYGEICSIIVRRHLSCQLYLDSILTSFQWGLIIPLLLLQKRGNEQVLPYCAAELYNPTLAKNTEYVLIVAEGCALLIFVVLWNHNHKKSVRLCSFYTRLFNASQNVSYALRRKAFVTRVFLLLFLKLNGFCSCSSVNFVKYYADSLSNGKMLSAVSTSVKYRQIHLAAFYQMSQFRRIL